MYLLDTNICIDVLRGGRAVDRQLEHLDRVRIYTSVISAAELVYGAVRSEQSASEMAIVDAFLRDIPVLQLDNNAAHAYGLLKAFLAKQGRLLEDNDLYIAAIALSRNLILVTHDKGFDRIPNLQLEDWLV
jgi:tRNA(fMet)-specific endonuclease VapC